MQDRHDVDLAWLEDLVVLAETGNFSRAAEARGVTQPAFSRRVKSLEAWVGVPLFVRTPQGAVLTPAGELFHRGVPALVRTLAQLRREASETGGREAATLHFAATHALSFTFFPHWIRSIELGVPMGPVQLLSESMRACEELMLQGRAQFLLCHHHPIAPGRLDPRQFRSVMVGEDMLAPFAAPGPAGGPRWDLDAAAGAIPLLGYGAESGLGRIVAGHRFADRLETRFEAQLAATLLGMAREGSGVAWLPVSLAAQEVERGALVRAGGSAWEIAVEVRLFRPMARQAAAAERLWAALGLPRPGNSPYPPREGAGA